jgi:phosphatidylglycerophosphatase A|tara:strand:- start:579 stop:1067 length:489 start_codon:yes stop_codon:yes gene_type:complete
MNQNKKTLKNPFFFIASLGGIGLIRFAPGTFGSIFSWFLFIYLSHYLNMIVLTSLMFFLGIWVCENISKDLEEKDDKSIVVDELIGMWIALMPTIYFADTQAERTTIAILALVLFRFFDIVKPYPINLLDQKFKNGFGIVIDDVAAGIITLLILIPVSVLLF